MDELSLQSLPLGFRFRPTDEELINHYLKGKISGHQPEVEIIPEIDVCKCEPWDLPDKSVIKTDDKEWFFFSPRDRKYPNGHRSNRATEAGYWKATGKDRTIKCRTPSGTNLIGMKKTLVFHRGRAPKGARTNWIMHEYRTTENDDEGAAGGDQGAYVLYRLFRKPEGNIVIPNLDEPEEGGNAPPQSTPADAKYSSGPAEEIESKNKHQTPAQFVQGLQVIHCSNKNQLGDNQPLTYKKEPDNQPARPDDGDTNVLSAVENCKVESPRIPRDGLLDAIVDPYNNPRTNSPILFGGVRNSEEFGYHLKSLAGGVVEKDPIADFLDSTLSNHSEYSSYELNDHKSTTTDILLENGVLNSVDGISFRASLGRSNEPNDPCKDEDLLQWEDFRRMEGPYTETPVAYMQGFLTDTLHDNLASSYHLAYLDQPFGRPEMLSINGASSVNDLAWRETAVRVLNEEPSHNLANACNMGQGTAARRIRLTRRIKLRSRSSGLVEQHSKQSSALDMNKPSHVGLIAHTVQEQQQNICCSKILHEDDKLLKMSHNKEQPGVAHGDMPDYSVDGLTEKVPSNLSKINDQNDQHPADSLSKQLNQVIRLDRLEPLAEQSTPFLRMRDDKSVSDPTRYHYLLEDDKGRSRFVRLALWVMSAGVLALAVGMIYLQGVR